MVPTIDHMAMPGEPICVERESILHQQEFGSTWQTSDKAEADHHRAFDNRAGYMLYSQACCGWLARPSWLACWGCWLPRWLGS